MSSGDPDGLYEVLGVETTASITTIKKAFRKLALQHHPDKQSSASPSTVEESKILFNRITHAYSVLSDEQQRREYDTKGWAGGSQGMGGAMRPEDIFEAFFSQSFGGGGFGGGGPPPFGHHHGSGGRHGGRTRQREPARTPDVLHRYSMTLDDVFCGKTTRLAITRTRTCLRCDGRGVLKVTTCTQCLGHGSVVARTSRGNVVHEMRVRCPTCHGHGAVLDPNDMCGACSGRCVVEERNVLELKIEPGARHGDRIRFPGQADQRPGCEPADLIVELNQEAHPRFQRSGNDLRVEHTLTLREALCGFTIHIEHLLGHLVTVTQPAGEVVHPGDSRTLHGAGLPVQGKLGRRGALIIVFAIEFPKSLSTPTMRQLADLLPAAPSSVPPANATPAARYTLQPGADGAEPDDDDGTGAAPASFAQAPSPQGETPLCATQ
jgi:DnaJ family protein A protein 2